ncbi:MAG: hypothetical protein H6Q68_4055, partial [Firmicutes bacterium]|nr:hypothetical protein [Bacillota bacterium]
ELGKKAKFFLIIKKLMEKTEKFFDSERNL